MKQSKLEYKFQDQENSEDIFSFGSALEDFIYVVFVPDRNIPTIEENSVSKTKKYEELSATEKIQADCDLKATNIILQGLPSDVYSLERECKLYDAFDKFAHIKGELLHQYYLGFTQLINDMNIYKMKLEKFQVNTKFLYSLSPEWINQQTHLAEFPQINSGLAVPIFKQGDDHIDAINKMMSFLSTVDSSRFPTTNNQLRNSSNPRQQETIHDRRVTVQPVQGRQSSFATSISGTRAKISKTGGNNSSQQRVVKCFNFQGEGHMARQCPKPKRKRDATWFRDKVLLLKAQGSGKVLNKRELEFLADPGVAEGPITQTFITHNATHQADDLDAYDSEGNDFSIAKAVLMTNLLSYGSDVLSEKAQQIRPMLYDGSVIAKETNVISIADSKETLMLEEES
ncbi:retrovirus-related pol polyprotein from transposon TNT 1-94 [Tanacetum coccineum]